MEAMPLQNISPLRSSLNQTIVKPLHVPGQMVRLRRGWLLCLALKNIESKYPAQGWPFATHFLLGHLEIRIVNWK
jgi:hypothetical protein